MNCCVVCFFLAPHDTRAPMGEIWREGRLFHAEFHPPPNRRNMSPLSKSHPPHRTNYAVVLAARNAASNNALLRCASKKTRIIFTSAAQQRAARPRL